MPTSPVSFHNGNIIEQSIIKYGKAKKLEALAVRNCSENIGQQIRVYFLLFLVYFSNRVLFP